MPLKHAARGRATVPWEPDPPLRLDLRLATASSRLARDAAARSRGFEYRPPTVDAVFHYARSDSNLGDLVGRYAELGMTEFLCFPEANDQQPLMEDVANSLPRSADRLGRRMGCHILQP